MQNNVLFLQKQCLKCKVTKPLAAFYRRKSPIAFQPFCIECYKAAVRNNRAKVEKSERTGKFAQNPFFAA